MRHLFLLLTILFIPYSSITLFGNPFLFLPIVFFMIYFVFSIRNIKSLFDLAGTKKLLLPWIFIWLLFFLAIVVNYNPESLRGYRSTLQRILISLVFFLMVFNEIRHNPGLKEGFQNAVILSVLFMGILYFGGFAESSADERFTLFGANPNTIGVWAVTGVLFAFDRIVQRGILSRHAWYWLLVVVVGFIIIVLTGSKKAVFMLAAGIIVYYVFLNRSFIFKLKLIIPLAILSFFAARYVTGETLFMARMEREMGAETITLSGRIPLWEVAADIIRENPIIGAGYGEYMLAVDRIVGRMQVPHNEFLTVAILGGIPALLLFLYFLGVLGSRAFKLLKTRNENFTTLPLSLLVILIMFLATAGGGLASFFTFFLFAFIAGSTIIPKNE